MNALPSDAVVTRVRKIYVASSWRNKKQPLVVEALRNSGHQVYDFRNPQTGDRGFHWSEIDPKWKEWGLGAYVAYLRHPVAEKGFASDWNAMSWADTCVLLQPCGRSSHLEAGYFIGAKKRLLILLDPEGFEPELMYKMAAKICCSIPEVIDAL